MNDLPSHGPARPATDGRLSGLRPIAHDDDERPSREDLRDDGPIFTRSPVPLPRWLTGRKKPKPH